MAKGKKRLPKEVKNTYYDYKRKYLTARETLAKRGESMYDNYLLSEGEWEALNKSFENKYKREIKKGERERMPNINDVIVKQQTYEYSQKQAVVFRQEMMKKDGIIISEREIMLGKFSKKRLDMFYDELEQEYNTLTNNGVSGKDAKLAISYKYFGSK